jgi:conjugal transfer pilus assembly protein TraE
MNNVLKITDPASYGAVKAKMVVVTDQLRGSDITQLFEIQTMTASPDNLHTEVTGQLHVFLGQKQVSVAPVRYYFDWTYRGLTLRLSGFGEVVKPVEGAVAKAPNPYIERGGEQ